MVRNTWFNLVAIELDNDLGEHYPTIVNMKDRQNKHRNLDQAALIIKKGVKYGFVYDGSEKQSYFAYAMKYLSVGICFMLLDYGYPIQKALE